MESSDPREARLSQPLIDVSRSAGVRVWIDTDVGSDVDDALAIAYALRHGSIELVGLSTVFGDVALRTRIAERLLALADAPAIPIVTGLGAPLTTGKVGRMFGHEGIGLLNEPDPVMRTESDPDRDRRIDTLVDALEAAKPDALVAIGPMTNLGALAELGHPLPPITVMGGKTTDVSLPGMVPQIPEWNWWCDPVAVSKVLEARQASAPRIVPIEVTIKTPLPETDVGRLRTGDALTGALAVLCDEWLVAQRDRLGSKSPRVLLHDPLAVATLVDADVAPFAAARIRVDEDGATHREEKGAAVEIATDVRQERLREHLMQTWLAPGGGGSEARR